MKRFQDILQKKKHENKNDNFKIHARKNIINKGYNIILCIGSNDTDIYDELTEIQIDRL